MTGLRTKEVLKVADETWIAAALLQREHPDREDFTIAEIVARAEKEGIAGDLRPGVRVHATLHCVANLPPNPGRYRMLFATGRSTRRLFRPGDPYDRAREGGKTVPNREDIPPQYSQIIDWYESEYSAKKARPTSSLAGLRGVARHLWEEEDPDAYVRRLREGWE